MKKSVKVHPGLFDHLLVMGIWDRSNQAGAMFDLPDLKALCPDHAGSGGDERRVREAGRLERARRA
jgi:hypothetical protein